MILVLADQEVVDCKVLEKTTPFGALSSFVAILFDLINKVVYRSQ